MEILLIPEELQVITKLKCALFGQNVVSPIQQLTIPVLESMAAIIVARMSEYLKDMFNFENFDIYIWSDSTIVLFWIKGSTLNWKPFEAIEHVHVYQQNPFWMAKHDHFPGLSLFHPIAKHAVFCPPKLSCTIVLTQ